MWDVMVEPLSFLADDAEPGEALSVGSSFQDFYRATYPSLRAAVGLGANAPAADDATAEAFARAYQHWARVSKMTSPAGWTYRVAQNLLRRDHRRTTIERRLLRRTEPAPPTADPGSLARAQLVEMLDSLPPRMRTAIILRYVADLSEAAVADAMGLSRGGVSSLLTKARAHLRAEGLDPEEGTS
jgi:RNA polymerase sigma-70 factor (ECF subfamily)